MRLLLHICCAPCSIYCLKSLRGEGIEPVGYWFNPNIHPFTEYRARKNALVDYAKSVNLELIIGGEYGLREFITGLPSIDGRCGYCYQSRLNQAAKFAGENGFDAFSSTLLISPYQNHALLKLAGERAQQQFSVDFLYRDFRPGFKEGQAEARALDIYMQKYCGCIFSEQERYDKRFRRGRGDARGAAP